MEPSGGVSEGHRDVFFVLRNLRDDLATQTEKYSSALYDAVKKRIDSDAVLFLVLTSISMFFVLLSILVILPILTKVQKTKIYVSSMYCQIPAADARKALISCERFLDLLSSENDNAKGNVLTMSKYHLH